MISWEASRFPTPFWMQYIFLVTLILTDPNTRNFSFTFIICRLINCKNQIDFWSMCERVCVCVCVCVREREREREWQSGISYGFTSETDETLRLERSEVSDCVDVRISPDFVQTHAMLPAYLLWMSNLSDFSYEKYIFTTQNSLPKCSYIQAWTSKDGYYIVWDLSFILSMFVGL